MNFTKEDLQEQAIAFNNEHHPEKEAFEIVLDFHQISTWDNPFKLFVNGELEASFKTFKPLKNRAEKLIKQHDLLLVCDDIINEESVISGSMNNKGPFAPF